MKRFFFFLFLVSSSFCFATYIGNPASCYYFKNGIISDYQWINLRASFVYDRIYKCIYYQKNVPIFVTKPLKFEMRSALISLNVSNYMDIYGIIGSAQEVVDDCYSNERFCWGGGARFCFFHIGNFAFGGDGRYFQSALTTKYALIEESLAPVDIVPPCGFLYQEVQGAFTITYNMGIFLPYIGPYYLYSRNNPVPTDAVVRISGDDRLYDFGPKFLENKRKWGLLLGANLLSEQKFDLTLEGRFIAQNGISIAAEVRF